MSTDFTFTRSLLIRAFFVRRVEQARDDPSLLIEAASFVTWATTEADHLTRILDRLQGADLAQGGAQ